MYYLEQNSLETSTGVAESYDSLIWQYFHFLRPLFNGRIPPSLRILHKQREPGREDQFRMAESYGKLVHCGGVAGTLSGVAIARIYIFILCRLPLQILGNWQCRGGQVLPLAPVYRTEM